MSVGGAVLLQGYDAFQIGVSGDEVGLMIYQGEGELFGLVEQIAPKTFLAFEGQAFGSVGGSFGSTIAARLDGVIEYCVLQSDTGWNYDCSSSRASLAYARCPSASHQLTLSRR